MTFKYLLSSLLFLLVLQTSYGQKNKSSKDLKNVCNYKHVMVYGDQAPRPIDGFQELELQMNQEMPALKKHDKFKGTVLIECTISCEGVIDNFNVLEGSLNKDLDDMIIEYMSTLDQWHPGRHQKEKKDYWFLWELKFKKGELEIK